MRRVIVESAHSACSLHYLNTHTMHTKNNMSSSPQIQEADLVIYNNFLQTSQTIEDHAQEFEFQNLMHALDSLLPLTASLISKDKMFAVECLLSNIRGTGLVLEPATGHIIKGAPTSFVLDCYQAYFIRLADIILLLPHTPPVLATPTHGHHHHKTYSLRVIITDFQRELDHHIDMKDLSYEYKTPQQLSELLNVLSFLKAHGLREAHAICEKAFKIRLGHHWSVAYRFQQHLPSLDFPEIEYFRLEKYLSHHALHSFSSM